MGKELPSVPTLDFVAFDKNLDDYEVMEEDEDTKELSFPKINYIY